MPTGKPRGNKLLTGVAAALAVFGVLQLTSHHAASGPPEPTTAVVGALPPIAPPTTTAATLALPRSVPTSIDIPAINLHAAIISVDLGANDSLGTPPLSNAKVAGWYDRGPTPGETGAAILDAHVDSALMKDYRGAFFTLGNAKPGMRIDVTRTDHSTATFTIDEVQVALKTAFPTAQVYAATTYPALRLITCGGAYDKATHEYVGNTIVYAHMTGSQL